MYRVYKYTNKINNKVYIGYTKLTPAQRSGKNGKNYKVCPGFWSAIQEFGWCNFVLENLEIGLSKEQAEKLEREYIKKYQSDNPEYGYNIQTGGSHLFGKDNMFYGKHHNESTKQAVAESNKRRVWTEEAKQSIRNKLSGDRSPFSRAVMCLDTGKIYLSIKSASIDTGISSSKISTSASKNKSVKGFHWIYVDP